MSPRTFGTYTFDTPQSRTLVSTHAHCTIRTRTSHALPYPAHYSLLIDALGPAGCTRAASTYIMRYHSTLYVTLLRSPGRSQSFSCISFSYGSPPVQSWWRRTLINRIMLCRCTGTGLARTGSVTTRATPRSYPFYLDIYPLLTTRVRRCTTLMTIKLFLSMIDNYLSLLRTMDVEEAQRISLRDRLCVTKQHQFWVVRTLYA